MREADDFLSADEVYIKVLERMPGIGIATVYRTLQLLTELGVLSRVTTSEGKARYRFSSEEAAAHRIVLTCSRCSRTRLIPATTGDVADKLHGLESVLAHDYGFNTEQSLHQYYGLCGDCSATDTTTRPVE
jgi:Fur family ferric uptake transcriptional regulator